jgi:peptidoglycan/LPS O-acetylase OafA/YrhL
VGGYLSSGYKLLFLLPLGNWACVMWGFPPSVANHLWSISIEEQFYFIYPLLLRIFDIRRIVLMAVIMFGIANLMRLVLVMSGASHSAIWCNTLARLDPLVCGALAAVWLRGGAPRLTQLQRIILGGTGLFLLVACSRFASPAGISSLVFYPVAAAGAILILMSSLMPKSLPRNYLTNTLIYLGRISYGLYVWHTLSLDLAERWKFGGRYSIQLATKVIMGFILTAAFSVASYELYESYFLKLKERFTLIPSRPV